MDGHNPLRAKILALADPFAVLSLSFRMMVTIEAPFTKGQQNRACALSPDNQVAAPPSPRRTFS